MNNRREFITFFGGAASVAGRSEGAAAPDTDDRISQFHIA